jgi:thioredoxin-related protein
MIYHLFSLINACLLLFSVSAHAVGEAFDASQIDDTPKIRDVQYPDWFKNSFLNLKEDLDEALEDGKKGIILYFGQKNCAYCEALMQVNFGQEKDIVLYTQKHFDVIPIDIWGSREVTDFEGNTLDEKTFAEVNKANFTPSLIFYGEDGKQLLQLRGYHTPYKMRAALEYVVDGYYQQESLRSYLARADPPNKDSKEAMNSEEFFENPPYILQRSIIPAENPLAVFFEQRSCHACDILHTEPLHDDITRLLLEGFDVVQLDMWSDTPVLTPDGKKLTAEQWASQLGLFYAPSIVFFDEQGKEVIRVNSVVGVYRLRGIVEYVLHKGYQEAPTFQRWREMQQMVPFPPENYY